MKSNRHILIFTPTPPPYHGSNIMSRLLVESNINRRYDIVHINTNFSKEIKDLQKYTLKKSLLFFKYLLKLIITRIKYNPEYIVIIPAFQKNPFIISYIYISIAKILGEKIILWIHSNNIKKLYDENNILFKYAIKSIFRNAYQIVPCATSLANKNYNYFSNNSKIHTIPNGMHVKIAITEKNREYITITYLSNMVQNKGWKILFEAANIICKEFENIIFYFYGNPTKDSPIELINNTFKSSDYQSRIKYNGPVYGEEKLKVLANTDIFCFPTFYPAEAFPLSIIEAMAYSLPIITTDKGGITEAIVDGKSGFIVKQKCVNDLVEKIQLLISNREMRKTMGEFNHARYLELFTYEKFENNWTNLLKSL